MTDTQDTTSNHGSEPQPNPNAPEYKRQPLVIEYRRGLDNDAADYARRIDRLTGWSNVDGAPIAFKTAIEKLQAARLALMEAASALAEVPADYKVSSPKKPATELKAGQTVFLHPKAAEGIIQDMDIPVESAFTVVSVNGNRLILKQAGEGDCARISVTRDQVGLSVEQLQKNVLKAQRAKENRATENKTEAQKAKEAADAKEREIVNGGTADKESDQPRGVPTSAQDPQAATSWVSGDPLPDYPREG